MFYLSSGPASQPLHLNRLRLDRHPEIFQTTRRLTFTIAILACEQLSTSIIYRRINYSPRLTAIDYQLYLNRVYIPEYVVHIPTPVCYEASLIEKAIAMSSSTAPPTTAPLAADAPDEPQNEGSKLRTFLGILRK